MNKENKENQCFGAHESPVKTPLKQTATPNWLLAEVQPTASDHLTTPPKPNESSSGDPWTPTANLKMLISAASPEIRNREQEKKWSDSKNESLEDHLSEDEYEKSQLSRKEKSLGLLCHKFLARYPSYPNFSKNNEICLDEVAEDLNIERRRIYDIMNVLESLHMVSRLAKNRYSWHGRHNLKETLQVLKKAAEKNKYLQQIELVKKGKNKPETGNTGQNFESMPKDARPNYHPDFVELPGTELQAASVNSRKDKSLRVMSQKFVMLFLVSTPQLVSLEVAAKSLIGEDHFESLDKSKFKTKIRRLYDIANVLSSLELIEKVHIREEKSRKPAFKWIGPDVFSDIKDTQPKLDAVSPPMEDKSCKEHCSKNLFPTSNKQNFTRHPSLIKLARSKQNEQRKSRSAPSSPVKKHSGPNPSTFPNKMAQLAAICKQQLDEQSREFEKVKKKLEHTSPSESCLKSSAGLVPSQVMSSSLTSNSKFPAILPSVLSSVPCAVYLNPSQVQVVTTYRPNYMVHPVSTSNVVEIKSPVKANLQVAPAGTFTKDSSNNWGKAEDLQLWLTKEPNGTTDDLMPGKCFKRSKLLLEDNPIKKCKTEEVELQDSLLGESDKNKNHQASVALHLNQEVLISPVTKQNKHVPTEVEFRCEQKKQGDVFKYDKVSIPQEMPPGLAAPIPKDIKVSSEVAVSSKEKTELCAMEKKSYDSSILSRIPVTSSFPTFHITPLNLMLPPPSVETTTSGNSSAVASVHVNPSQSQSTLVLNIVLQQLGIMPANVQKSADHVHRSALICQGAEHVGPVPVSVGLQQVTVLKNALRRDNRDLPEELVPTTTQETTVPVTFKDFKKGSETPSEPGLDPGFH
ncbi:transcription factor E2F8 [Python bivittatus]|uniref:Transcription factor E2F8 n=1 Tax=Python bivittatus TaxID=176946 RepID=A0A9F2WAN9_PYTBI|nr:transcription factor E2F8 [Python bivittatus]